MSPSSRKSLGKKECSGKILRTCTAWPEVFRPQHELEEGEAGGIPASDDDKNCGPFRSWDRSSYRGRQIRRIGAAGMQSWPLFGGLTKDFCSKQIVIKVFSTLNAHLNSNNRPASITI